MLTEPCTARPEVSRGLDGTDASGPAEACVERRPSVDGDGGGVRPAGRRDRRDDQRLSSAPRGGPHFEANSGRLQLVVTFDPPGPIDEFTRSGGAGDLTVGGEGEVGDLARRLVGSAERARSGACPALGRRKGRGRETCAGARTAEGEVGRPAARRSVGSPSPTPDQHWPNYAGTYDNLGYALRVSGRNDEAAAAWKQARAARAP